MQIHLGVQPERARGRMFHGHFGERPHDREGHKRAQHEADNDGGTRQFHSDGAAEKKPGTDRTAQADHGHLVRFEFTAKARLALNDLGGRSGLGHGGAVNVRLNHSAAS